jgi:hypothetical protein
LSKLEVIKMLESGKLQPVLEKDEFITSSHSGKTLKTFQEAPISFDPTVTTGKPFWGDRVLFNDCLSKLKVKSY